MKAFVMRSYGAPGDLLTLEDIPQPVPSAGEVLVRVRATSVNPYDWHYLRGEPIAARFMGALPISRPKYLVLGCDMAGVVEAVGPGTERFQPGDAVYGLIECGGFGEYVCVRESELAPLPGNLSFEEAAAVPMAGCTALLAVRDDGKVRAGQRVLVAGASGGVGTFAVQIAKALGAQVTAVCGPANVDMVRSIGADDVIDHSEQDFVEAVRDHDVVIDIAGTRSAAACRRVLKAKGIYVVVGGPAGRWMQPVGHMLGMAAVAPFSSQRMVRADVVAYKEKSELLRALTGLFEAGRIRPVIGRRYPFGDLPAAVRYQEAGRPSGKVVITF